MVKRKSYVLLALSEGDIRGVSTKEYYSSLCVLSDTRVFVSKDSREFEWITNRQRFLTREHKKDSVSFVIYRCGSSRCPIKIDWGHYWNVLNRITEPTHNLRYEFENLKYSLR